MAAKVRGITIELGADTSGLNKALGKVNSEIGKTQKELKDVNKLLKLDPGNTELMAQKQRMLKDAVSETKDKLNALKNAQDEITESYKNGEIDQGQYEAFQREIISCENELKNLQKELAESNVVAQELAHIGEGMQKIGGGVESAGKKLLPVTAGIVSLGTATSKMAIDFEDAIAKVSTIADDSEVPIDNMKEAILNLSSETGIAAGEIAENVYNAISAGQKTGDAVEFVGKATSLARAGFAETGDALDILTTIMNAYGLEADKVSEVSDMLIQTQNLGKTTVGELSAAMGKVIPTAKAQGVELDDLAASYAVMTSNGIATAETTTYLNGMLNELGKQGSKAADAFAEGTEHIKEGGLTMAEAMEQGWELTDVLSILDEAAAESGTSIANMFGSAEAGKAAAVLWDNASQLNEAVESMRDSAGATETAFNKLDTTSYEMQKSFNDVKNAGIELGEAVMQKVAPLLEKLIEIIKNITTWFSNLNEDQMEMIVKIGALVAALGPVLIIGGKIISFIGSILSFIPTLMGALSGLFGLIAANPIVLVIGAIIAILILLIKNWDKVKEAISNGWEAIKTAFSNGWSALKNICNSIANGIKNIFNSVWSAIKGIINKIIGGVESMVNGIANGINKVLSGINTVANAVGGAIGLNPINLSVGSVSLPKLAKGGTVLDGSAIVGEAGAELLNVNNGVATVQPLTNGGNASHTNITDLLETYLPYLADQKGIYLDGRTLVGGIIGDINNQLGVVAQRGAGR